MKKTILVILILVILGIVWFTVGKQSSAPVGGEPIKIGVASLLTGDFAVVGENIANTSRLVADQINEAGGVNGRVVELSIEDSKADSASGLSAVQKLVNVDGVKYVIAGMTSNGTLAAAPLVNDKKVVTMTPVTGGKNVDEAGEYIFRTANADVLAGRDLANAMLKLGYKNVGIVSEITEYTLDIKNSFKQTIKTGGGTVVVAEEFLPAIKDYRTMVSKVREAKPQALLVLSNLGTNAGQFIKQMRDLGYSVPLFTDFTLIANESAKQIAGSFDGIYFADPSYAASSEKLKQLFALYEEKYGHAPAIPFHAAATYDAIQLLATAIAAVGDDSVKVHDWLLANVKSYSGLMGTFSLDANGNSDLGFVIKQVKGDQFVEIK